MMHKMMVVCLCVFSFWHMGCGSGADGAKMTSHRPTILRIAFSPGQEEVEERVKTLQPVTDYLAKELDMEVTMVRTSSYSTIIEAMRAEKIDVAGMGPFTYVIASEKTNVDLLAAWGSPDVGARHYNSYFITHPNSGIKTMEDVVNRAGDIVLQFVDPASTSGHLVPRSHLMSLGLDPENDFKRVIFGMSHTTTILTAVSEKVALAGCASSSLQRMLEAGTVKEDDFVTLWKSPPIPSSPMCIRGTLPDAFKEEVRAAYLKMKMKSPEAWGVMTSQFRDTSLVLMATHDSIYAPLRELAYQIDLLKDRKVP